MNDEDKSLRRARQWRSQPDIKSRFIYHLNFICRCAATAVYAPQSTHAAVYTYPLSDSRESIAASVVPTKSCKIATLMWPTVGCGDWWDKQTTMPSPIVPIVNLIPLSGAELMNCFNFNEFQIAYIGATADFRATEFLHSIFAYQFNSANNTFDIRFKGK